MELLCEGLVGGQGSQVQHGLVQAPCSVQVAPGGQVLCDSCLLCHTILDELPIPRAQQLRAVQCQGMGNSLCLGTVLRTKRLQVGLRYADVGTSMMSPETRCISPNCKRFCCKHQSMRHTHLIADGDERVEVDAHPDTAGQLLDLRHDPASAMAAPPSQVLHSYAPAAGAALTVCAPR